MSHRFMYSNLIDESAVITSLTAAVGFVGGAVPRVANGPGTVVFSGRYTGDDPEIYTVEIDLAGDVGTATFKWKKSTSSGWEASGLTTALTDTTLEAGVSVRFLNGSSSPAFVMGDRWQATATRFRSPKRVIELDPATKWRGGAPAVDPEFLMFDLLTAQAPDAVVVHGHNISPGATMKIQGGEVYVPIGNIPELIAAEFDGVDSHISAAANAAYDSMFAGGGTIAVWVYIRSDGEGSEGKVIALDNSASGDDTWLLDVRSESGGFVKLSFLHDTDAAFGFFQVSTTNVSINAWHHLLITYNTTTPTTKPLIYLDGVAQAVTIATSPTGTPLTGVGEMLYIGTGRDLARDFDGYISGIRLYTRALTAAEAAAHYAGTYTDETNLVGHWQLNDASGTTATDSSGTGNDGTLSGSAAWTSNLIETITWVADTMHKYLATSPRSFRYWRILIEGDSGNSDGYLEIAEVFLGGYFEPEYNYEFGNVLGEQSFEEARETESKAEKTVLLNRGQTAALPYRHISAAQKNLFLAMYRTVKDTAAERNKPLFTHLDVNDSESLIFAVIGGPFSPSEAGPDDFSFELELRERLV
ncbi:MAG: LamG domain-containing protein [Nitrospinaceae bacterium]|jgi:hypothetical protein|nr:LamG domain-containing protein [Nitrospinaceae bacterium]MBT3435509.1 LamG domain-containing protein [Nitrospinaceae bacterium]MBT3821074.1 LamG domain-containing protein [Nitrospinaceae bacterium]MBT4430412.1 LamG domain-containing protein [Nitrospinaceae bacterium]MBT5368672.1 LamG domain-containing protein [Nitrospinaceae bacterium]